jgi:hypothetical protein
MLFKKQSRKKIRIARDLVQVERKPVPSAEENAAAEQRLRDLDAIESQCAWDKFEAQCTNEELEARDRWRAIMNRQGEYEELYC